ncbi:GNAT family N-acetyltransferase [Streptomyces hoynatensis]|uniref:GNAT family N-acetyltransferase n=2 Tax=Streptomyces hoynatensis TaxID=1141874 RepID=A0A3A9Z0N8_9ACTN|nr:GNAT family N-acetyltransferase [Streptomyces hoynatensis]
MLDGAVAWLVGLGRTGQWGTEPWSARPQAVRRVREIVASGTPWVAEVDGEAAGSLTLTPHPAPYVAPADEPERYVHLLVTDRRFKGLGVGGALLAHAVAETRRQGVGLLRVDCYAGDDQRLVAYYRGQGFTPTETFTVGEWPGQVLARRVTP